MCQCVRLAFQVMIYLPMVLDVEGTRGDVEQNFKIGLSCQTYMYKIIPCCVVLGQPDFYIKKFFRDKKRYHPTKPCSIVENFFFCASHQEMVTHGEWKLSD